MQERRTPGSCFGRTLYFTDREIDQICLEALKESDCLPLKPEAIEIDFFVEKHFQTNLDYGTEFDEKVLGWTCFGKSGEILLVGISSKLADDQTEVGQRRCRATIAHEAGHCLMHPILFMEDRETRSFENVDMENRKILCRKDDIAGRYDGRWWEVQANKAIGALLMPSRLVQESVQEFLVIQGTMGITTLPEENRKRAIEHVADTFEVNKKPAEIKLEKLFPADANTFL